MTVHALKYLKKTRDQLIANALLHKRRANEAFYNAATCKPEFKNHFQAWREQQEEAHQQCCAELLSFQDAINALDPDNAQVVTVQVAECWACNGEGCVSDDPEVKGSVVPCAHCNAVGKNVGIRVES